MTLVRPIVRSIVRGIVRGDALDADAAAFIAATGATDVKAIDAWVRGIKDLGLWDNMVCWPLRSSQNYGTGTAVKSLGGLGVFDGTMVNGPTWGEDGITFDGSNDHITTGITFNYNIASMIFAAVNRTSSGTNPRIVGTNGVANGPFFYRAVGSSAGVFNGASYSTFTTPSNETWNSVSHAFGSTTLRGIINQSSTSVSYTPAAVTQSFQIAAGQAAVNFWNGKMALVGYVQANVSETDQLALHALYKQTLGASLGLP